MALVQRMLVLQSKRGEGSLETSIKSYYLITTRVSKPVAENTV